jgi:hypothetical protein
MIVCARQAFNGGDLLGSLHRANGIDARAYSLAIDMNGAGTALGYTARILRAGQSDVLSDNPEQGRIALNINFKLLAVNSQCGHDASFLVLA